MADGSGSCVQYAQQPAPGTVVSCPIDSTCRATFAEVIAAQADAGTCDAPFAISVQIGTCGSHQVWHENGGLWFKDCIYDADGALVGSANCGDTGCRYGGLVIDDVACATDAGLAQSPCGADAGG